MYTWAVPKLKGKDGKRDSDVLVLPAAIYNMNSWDTASTPERTRWRWKRGIVEQLKRLENEALAEVASILDWEGLPVRGAA